MNDFSQQIKKNFSNIKLPNLKVQSQQRERKQKNVEIKDQKDHQDIQKREEYQINIAKLTSSFKPKSIFNNSKEDLQQKQLKSLKKNSSEQPKYVSQSFHEKSENKIILQQIVASYAFYTKAGCNSLGPKTNQDNFIIYPNLNKFSNRYLFAVCDGHGVYGHDVSAFIRNTYPTLIENLLARDIQSTEEEYISSCLRLSFYQLSQKLLESQIDCTFSGSTFIVVLIIQDKLWCANTGDSRAILAKQIEENEWKVEELSNDHKADNPEEKQRIEESGGRVDSYRNFNGDPVGPARVWMIDEDIPGLAMSRSFGDLIAAQCGVVCDPEIKYFNIQNEDKFIVIASDGIWEFLNNKQIMHQIVPYYIRKSAEMACQKIGKEANSLWKLHDEIVDDITAVCIYLNQSSPNGMKQKEEKSGEQQEQIKIKEKEGSAKKEKNINVHQKQNEKEQIQNQMIFEEDEMMMRSKESSEQSRDFNLDKEKRNEKNKIKKDIQKLIKKDV